MQMDYNSKIRMMDDLLRSQKEENPYPVTVLGKRFVVHPGVFSPRYYPDTEFFARVLPLQATETLLEIGCGTGIICILAHLLHGVRAIGVDINPQAVTNAKENVDAYNLANHVTIHEGSLFAPIAADERFDTVFWNVPFGLVQETDLAPAQRAIFDPGYRSIRNFVAQARQHVVEGGQIFVGFSTTLGKVEELERIVADNQARLHLAASDEIVKGNFRLNLELFELRYQQ